LVYREKQTTKALLIFKHGANVKNKISFSKKILENILSELDLISKFAPR